MTAPKSPVTGRRRKKSGPWWQRHPILTEKLLLAFNTFWQAFATIELGTELASLRAAILAGIAALFSLVPKLVGEALENVRVYINQIKGVK